MNTTSTRPAAATLSCATRTDLFHHRLDPDKDTRSDPDAVREARKLCKACPLFTECLGNALVGPEVAGFVAGTTESERAKMRRALRLSQRRVEVDEYVTGRSSRTTGVDYDKLRALVERAPALSTSEIAHRAGCSESAVKRFRRSGGKLPSTPRPGTTGSQAPDSPTLKKLYSDNVKPVRGRTQWVVGVQCELFRVRPEALEAARRKKESDASERPKPAWAPRKPARFPAVTSALPITVPEQPAETPKNPGTGGHCTALAS